MALRIVDIERAFDLYNASVFGGRLSMPDILVRKMKTDLARWYSPDEDYPAGLLIMNGHLAHDWGWKATLLHELVHIAIPDDELDDHGPLFTAECNRIGAMIGLEPCDIHDSWAWPSHHLSGVPACDADANIMDD